MKEIMCSRMGFIIYKAENIQNGYVYVGATTRTSDERKKDHLLKAKGKKLNKFHKAISTYGAEAFEWSQLDTAINNDELAQKEKEYILKYNSKEDGYNSDAGGGIQKTVYQYCTKEGKLINKYNSITNAANAINVTKQKISAACLGINRTCKGFYWSYEYKEPFEPNIDNRRKKVAQIDSEGKIVAEFASISEAAKHTGFNKSSIAKVCRGERKSCGSYIWNYV